MTMDLLRCLAIILVLWNNKVSEAVRQRISESRYSRTSNKAAEQINPSHYQVARQAAAWTEWAVKVSCSVSCGGTGYVERERNCTIGDVKKCASILDGTWWSVETCDNGPCVFTWTEWGSPTACSESCGKIGVYRVVRNCSIGTVRDCETNGGRYWDVRVCNNGPCQAHWLKWSEWGSCPQTCGIGVRSRLRDCSSGRASDCTIGKNYDLQACNEGSCTVLTTQSTTTTTTTTTPVPGVWSSWSEKVSCSKTCGPGFGEYTRSCSTGNKDDCVGNSWKVFACNLGECIVDGYWATWQTWSSCPVTCGGGQISRMRSCIYPDPDNIGESCKGDGTQVLSCNTKTCQVDGVWTNWSVWSQCSTSCDEGDQLRTRSCTFPPNVPHGKDCDGQAKDRQMCKLADCKVDGEWAPWSSWSICTKSCGNGLKFRARTCLFDDFKPRGADCPGSMIGRTSCNPDPCSVDGVWSDWSSWSQCTHTCNGGKRSRERVCTFTPAGITHGADCQGGTKEYQDCNLQGCPVDGIWGAWGPWGTCSKTCGGGTQAKTRTCLYRGSGSSATHGKPCSGEGTKTQKCRTNICPVDARWSIWSAFGSCNETCGGGFRVKSRTCIYDKVAPMGRNCTGSPEFSEECNPQPCPVDGTFTDWESWSYCSATCDGGNRFRHRSCHFPPNVPHGANCTGQLREDDVCNESPCPTTTTTTTTEAPVDGHWSKFSAWSDCSASCGGGVKSRERNCTFPDKALHGQYCPGSNNQTVECKKDHCPVDGFWGEWGNFGRCSVSCGNGTNSRRRRCQFDNRYPKGADCVGPKTETGTCWAGNCPVDGVLKEWSAWHNCSLKCGGGTQDRTRICFFPVGATHGLPCSGSTHEIQTCNNELCPVDGNLTEWSTWTSCPVTCGTGTQFRNRTCYFPPDTPHGDDCIGALNQNQTCADKLCPVDGYWEEWSEWQECSQSCDGGVQKRKRRCLYDDIAPHGTKCHGPRREERPCNSEKCPVDGHWSPWSRWSRCSVSCENGTHARNRTCIFLDDVPHGSFCIGNGTEIEGCNDGLCPVNGTWSDWSVWGDCTVSCGNGTMLRNRSCDFPDGIPHGEDCVGESSETDVCGTDLCPVDGHFDTWSAWGTCSLTCGGGSQDRQRTCLFDDIAPHGVDCMGNHTDTQACNTELCAVDGVWSEWSNFTECTVTCGNGTRLRSRFCEFRPLSAPRGTDCPGPKTEEEICGTDLCAVDGVLSQWSKWTDCSKSCENGTQSHNRTCIFDDTAPQGEDCKDELYAVRSCNIEKCPENGQWSAWSNFTECSVSCAGGTQTRNRTCVFDESAPHGAKCYGNTTGIQDCNTGPCPVNGQWGDWNSWHDCSQSCGGGNKVRDRDCVFPDNVPHGNNCTTGQAHDIAECNKETCPVDGLWSDWSIWTACSASCGSGIRFHNRKCNYPDGVPHGVKCAGNESEQGVCNPSLCPVDGIWSDWSAWSNCPVTCGGSSQSRNRTCEYNIDPNNPAPHGKTCGGGGEETQPCNTKICAVDGVWSVWGDFSPCTKSCGNGTSTRTRTCEYLPAGSPQGEKCPGEGTDNIVCNTTECPQDAVWAEWSKWSDCSATCGGGNQTRDRVCQWPSSVHGNNCSGDSSEMQSCNDKLCAVDGVWSEWTNYSACSKTCDLGRQSRIRNCTYDAIAPHGAPCIGKSTQSKFCRITLCVVDGDWSQWTEWSICSVTCGTGGTSTRQRSCVFPGTNAPHGENCTGHGDETQSCDAVNGTECAVDGKWGTWGSWSPCSVSCGHGDETRTRSCIFDPDKPRGHDCPKGGETETHSCTQRSCPVDGVWLTWTPWSTCSASCGDGKERRTRQCHYQSHVPQGDPCLGQGIEEQACRTRVCPVDGVWLTWTPWSTCSVTCGDGKERRTRQCHYQSHVPQGEPCLGQSLEEQACKNNTCSVDGVLAPWSTWSDCSVTCGGGTQSRNRTCEFTPPGAPHGADCTGNLTETTSCSISTCPLPSTTPTTVVTTTPVPSKPRVCNQCTGPPVICEKLNAPKECPLDKQYCINELDNFRNASRLVIMRCGTRDECRSGWFEKYSPDDKCTKFNQDYISTNQFRCEFCCNTDGCNAKINPDVKWHP